jgi:hypothetical protein
VEAHILNTIPEKECEVIIPGETKGNFKWDKKDEIFTLNGVMYDVSNKKTVDGKVYLYCIKEEKEMEILFDLTLKISSDDYNGKHFSQPFTEECILLNKEEPNKITDPSIVFPPMNISIIQQEGNIIVPPPRLTV